MLEYAGIGSNRSNCEYSVRNPVHAVLLENKRQTAEHFFWIFSTWHDPETQGVEELILSFSKSTHDHLMDGRVKLPNSRL